MDARRFDALARAMPRLGSRRRLLQGLAALTAGGFVAQARPTLALDAGPSDGTGAGVGACNAPIATTPGPANQAAATPRPTNGTTSGTTSSPVGAFSPPFPALIVGGTCDAPDTSKSFPLLDLKADQPTAGAKTAVAAVASATSVRAKLDDLTAASYAILVRASASDPTTIACGDLGGLLLGKDLAVGLTARNGSAYGGAALLRGGDATTLVFTILSPAGGSAVGTSVGVGSTVVTTIDLNLRATPAPDGAIVAVLGQGTTLTVTGPTQNGWIPVEDPATGSTGYVSVQYVKLPN